MALTATPVFPLMGRFPATSWFNAGTSRNISAGTHWVGTTFIAPYTGTINEIHFRTGTVSSPLMTLQCAVTNVDASGFPLGADIGSPATAVTNPAASTNYSATGLGASVTKGSIYGLIVRVSSFTSGSANIVGGTAPDWGGAASYPMNYGGACQNIGSNGFASAVSFVAPKYTTVGWVGSLYYLPIRSTNGSTSTGTASGNVIGNKFTIAQAMRVYGYWVVADCDVANIEMYSGSDNTAIANSSVAITGAYRGNGNGEMHTVLLATPVELAAGTYRVGVRNTSTTQNYVWRQSGFVDSTAVELLTLNGVTWMYTSYASGAWTDTNTGIAAVTPLIDQIHDGAGGAGGGGVRNPFRGPIG